MREEIVLGPVQGIDFQSVRPANQKICIWDIPLVRQLEMAVQEAPVPDWWEMACRAGVLGWLFFGTPESH